ncbi:MAG: hypothetical protein HC915_15500, partial [Anaerolineae bacterium]|nr:hypothetical protein [Anaerolineae bacterium]
YHRAGTHRPDLDQATIYRLILEKMPLVAVLGARRGQDPRLMLLGQWAPEGEERLALEPLVTWNTDEDPQRMALALRE